MFRPSLAVVQSTSWEDYVTSLEPALRRTGICRVVAPAGWTPRAAGYGGVDLEIPTPVRQACQGAKGLFRAMLMEEPALRLAGRGGFAEQALAPQNQPPGGPGADVDVRASAAGGGAAGRAGGRTGRARREAVPGRWLAG